MALQDYTITVPRGQEHLLPSPMARRAPIRAAAPATTSSGIDPSALEAIQRAKAYYQPGGGFGKGVEAGLERGRVKAVSAGMQHLVGAGLAGTTMAGTLGKKYEEEVGAPTRLGVEERRAQAISGIEMTQAGMGFQAGQTGMQRSLQLYLAQMQRDLAMQGMARRDRPTATTPTGGGYARQFPSIYDTAEQRVPDWMGTTHERPDVSFGEPMWGASERWRSEQPEWVTG